MYDDCWCDLIFDLMFFIDVFERICELFFNVKNNIVMFGIGEFMGFVVCLGIGCYVLCFVFFIDIGELMIDVFFVGNLLVDEVFY